MKKSVLMTCAALGLAWGCTYIFLKWSSHLITPLQTTFIRVLFGFLPIGSYALATGALSLRHLRYTHHFVAMSMLSATVYFFAISSGTALLPTAIAGLLNGAIPLFAFLCAWLFLRDEPMNLIKMAGIAVGFCGVIMIAAPWNADYAVSSEGVLFMLFGAFCFGSSFVYARRFLTPLKISAVALTTYQMGVALITLACITPMQGIDNLATEPASLIGIIFGLGFLSTGVAYIAYYRLVESEGAVTASVVTYIPPVVALLIGALSGERLSLVAWLAMVTILAGVAIVQFADRASRSKSQSAQNSLNRQATHQDRSTCDAHDCR